ncbi:MAG TPA: hypothetical protein VJC11_00610 [Patescibacteria group bacterium]|nr:hypothetical protein [Patescibacteria group bacterium]
MNNTELLTNADLKNAPRDESSTKVLARTVAGDVHPQELEEIQQVLVGRMREVDRKLRSSGVPAN